MKAFPIDKPGLLADFLLNFLSIAILGLSGIILNIVIARYYKAGELGIFNQVYAIYIIFSQLATIGVHVSTVKHVAQYSHKEEINRVISSALYLSFLFASILTGLLFLFKNAIGLLLGSPGVASALPYILPGLWFFALNKVFMGILNGFEKMKAYAFFTSLRGIGFIAGIIAAVSYKLKGFQLPLVFSITESIVFLALFFYVGRIFSFIHPKQCASWLRKHSLFGLKSISIGILTAIFAKIDLLVLGIFSTDRIVGIYSLPAMIIEGIYQIPLVLRRIFDPKLTKSVYNGQKESLVKLIRKGAGKTFIGMLPVYIAAVGLYPIAIKLLKLNPEFRAGWEIFAILSMGAIILSSYIPFSGLLVQAGHPGRQSLLVLMSCVTNIILNILLIPILGIVGAAIATSISFASFVIYFKLFVFRFLKLKI